MKRSRNAASRWMFCLGLLVAGAIVALMMTRSSTPRAGRRGADVADRNIGGQDARDRSGVPEESSPHAMRILVRDLADGKPVAGMPFTLSLGGSEITRSSDASGDLALLESEITHLQRIDADKEGWTAVGADWPLVREEGELWVYRAFVVRGTVRGAGPEELDPAAVRLEVMMERIGAQKASAYPCTSAWLRRHKNRIRTGWGDRVDVHGAFTLTIPRINGITIRASADSWRPAWGTPSVDSKTETSAVDLVMTRGYKVAGVLRDADGNPLKGVSVSAYVVRRFRFDELDIERVALEFEQGGGTAMKSRKNDYARSTIRYGASTDDRGRFEIDVKFDGDIWLIARPAGLGTARHHLGPTSRSVDDAALVALKPASPRTVRLLVNGVALANASVGFSNLGIKDVQPGFSIRTDGSGRVKTNWLEPGQRYSVMAFGKLPGRSRELVWKHQTSVDLTELPAVKIK